MVVMGKDWSRRAGLNRQPADYENSFKNNKFNAFKRLHVQQGEEYGTLFTPFAPKPHPEEITGNSSLVWLPKQPESGHWSVEVRIL